MDIFDVTEMSFKNQDENCILLTRIFLGFLKNYEQEFLLDAILPEYIAKWPDPDKSCISFKELLKDSGHFVRIRYRYTYTVSPLFHFLFFHSYI